MLGSTLAALCRERGIACTPFTREELDVGSPAAIEAFFRSSRATHLVNCAAYTDVDGAERECEKAFAVNAHAVASLAKGAYRAELPFIHISTDYVFGGEKELFTEEDLPLPLNVYGQSKRLGEELLFAYHPDACLIRTSSLFAPGFPNFVTKILSLAQDKETIAVTDRLISRPTCAHELASVILALQGFSGVYHFASKGALSRYEWAEKLLEMARVRGVPLACKEITRAAERTELGKRPLRTILSTGKIEALGIIPRPWQEGAELSLCPLFRVNSRL